MNHHPRERRSFVEAPLGFSRRLDDLIEELIAMRDALDGDADLEAEPDLEDGCDDEPSLGWAEREARRGRHAARCDPKTGAVYEIDAERDDCDREVTMPSAGNMPGWDDRQDVNPRLQGYAAPDDAENGHDAEPADSCP